MITRANTTHDHDHILITNHINHGRKNTFYGSQFCILVMDCTFCGLQITQLTEYNYLSSHMPHSIPLYSIGTTQIIVAASYNPSPPPHPMHHYHHLHLNQPPHHLNLQFATTAIYSPTIFAAKSHCMSPKKPLSYRHAPKIVEITLNKTHQSHYRYHLTPNNTSLSTTPMEAG